MRQKSLSYSLKSFMPPKISAPRRTGSPARQAPAVPLHTSEDKPRVKELYHQLKDAGFRPWLDKYDPLPGQRWRPAIKKLITDPHNLILVCLSNNSVTKRGVVQQEIKFSYPYVPTDGRENLEASSKILRVLRGGSWLVKGGSARCAYRGWDHPQIRDYSRGVRPVVSPIGSDF